MENARTQTAAVTQWKSGGKLGFDAAACLPERFPGQECGLCADACPTRAIVLDAGKPVLRGDCLACGQCTTQCLTGALRVDAFPLPESLPDHARIHIDCQRVPSSAVSEHGVRVPCLAGLSAGWLVQAASQRGSALHLTVRGWCGGCEAGRASPNGSAMDKLMAAVTEARLSLFECGFDESHLPVIDFLPTDDALMVPLAALTESAAPVSRRGFFRQLAGAAVNAPQALKTEGEPLPAPVFSLAGKIVPRERLRLVGAMATLAARHGRQIPARHLPQLTVAGSCQGHGVCAAVCPTGALQIDAASDGAGGLSFDPLHCIACGQCARNCPDRAIRMQPFGGDGAGRQSLIRWQLSACRTCGSEFPALGGRDQCPVCSKQALFSRSLAGGVNSLFAQSPPADA